MATGQGIGTSGIWQPGTDVTRLPELQTGQPSTATNTVLPQITPTQQVQPVLFPTTAPIGTADNVGQSITQNYQRALQDIQGNFRPVTQASTALADWASQQINRQQNQYQQAWNALQNQTNQYYNMALGNLGSRAGSEAALAAAAAVDSGAGVGAQRAAVNQVQNENFAKYSQMVGEMLNQKRNLLQELTSVQQQLRQEYLNTQDKYVLNQLNQVAQALNGLSAQYQQDLNNWSLTERQFQEQRDQMALQQQYALEQMRLQQALKGGGGGGTPSLGVGGVTPQWNKDNTGFTMGDYTYSVIPDGLGGSIVMHGGKTVSDINKDGSPVYLQTQGTTGTVGTGTVGTGTTTQPSTTPNTGYLPYTPEVKPPVIVDPLAITQAQSGLGTTAQIPNINTQGLINPIQITQSAPKTLHTSSMPGVLPSGTGGFITKKDAINIYNKVAKGIPLGANDSASRNIIQRYVY